MNNIVLYTLIAIAAFMLLLVIINPPFIYGSLALNGTMQYELSCEQSDSGLICGNAELDLCLVRTDMSDMNVEDIWNLVGPMLCEAAPK